MRKYTYVNADPLFLSNPPAPHKGKPARGKASPRGENRWIWEASREQRVCQSKYQWNEGEVRGKRCGRGEGGQDGGEGGEARRPE